MAKGWNLLADPMIHLLGLAALIALYAVFT